MKDRVRAAFADIRADSALVESTAAYLRGTPARREARRKPFAVPGWAGAAAVAAALVVGLFIRGLYIAPGTHVSIDVNPSVELTLNRFDRVIGAYAFNEEGARVLSGANPRGKAYEEAVGMLVAAMREEGYFSDGALVSVTVQTADRAKEETLCDSLRQFLGERMQSVQVAAEIEVYPVTAQVWSDAHGCNMSPAKYLEIRELMEVDREATLEDYSDSTIGQIRRRAQECRDAHAVEAGGDRSGTTSYGGQGHEQNDGQVHEQSAGQLHEQSAGQAHEQSAGQAHEQSDGQGHEQSAGQAHEQSAGQAHEQSDGQAHEQSAGQAHEQSDGQAHEQGNGQGHEQSDGQGHEQSDGQAHEQGNGQGRGQSHGQGHG